ncbi:MAG: nitroreductase family protein [Candidatus Omnitrophica bacterium]|nr:nitroreductase family protein [Candidatus Omnitrophota bacterium]
MDLFEALIKRHSYRQGFKNQSVPSSDLEKIVQAGIMAPSGKNAQTTEFIIVDDTRLVSKIGQMHSQDMFRQAKAFICCLIDKNPLKIYEGHSFAVEDCSAAVENMLLAITALGYASVWVDGWLRLESRAETISNLLSVPKGKVIRVILPIGVPIAVLCQKEKKSFDQRAWFNSYRRKDKV